MNEGKMMKTYDIIVIGSGAAAQTVAYELHALGKKLAIIEEKEWGGTCALRGCVPKKVLMNAAEVKNRAYDAKDKGISFDSLIIDWMDLINFKNTFTQDKAKAFKKSFRDARIDTYEGTAHFIDKDTLIVNDEKFVCENFIIATGAKPRPLDIAGEEFVITSEEFFSLDSLPESIIFIGGGLISFEFAHIAACTGSKVTILHRSQSPLAQFDKDLVKMLLEASKDNGIHIELNQSVEQVEKMDGGFIVKTNDNEEFKADLVVHGAGRIPNISKLQLENANISYSKRGIEVNEKMQNPKNQNVYAIGDVANSHLPLTPVAGAEGKRLLSVLLKNDTLKKDFSVIPSVVFTIPPLAMVGLTEDQAKQKDISYKIKFQDTSTWFSSKRIGLKHSGFKIIINEKNDQIIGAHLLGHHAEEIINLFSLFISKNMTVNEIKQLIWAYPTSAYEINYML